MLRAIIKTIASSLTGELLGRVEGIFKAYFEQKITREQLQAELQKALIESVTEIEKAHADALVRTYQTFMTAATQNPILLRVWAAVAISQLIVLLWHQVGISTLCYFVGVKACWPSSGTTADWAYLLLGALCGLGPVILRSGPAKLDLDKLKSLTVK